MTTMEAVDIVQQHMSRIRSSVFSNPSVALYICNTDLQDVALFHLIQAGGALAECPDAVQSLALSGDDAVWLQSFWHMTVKELDCIDHTALWKRMYAVIPYIA